MSSTMLPETLLGKKMAKKDEEMSQSKRNIKIRRKYLNYYLLLNLFSYLDCLLFCHLFFDKAKTVF